jgi:hypothetical protein
MKRVAAVVLLVAMTMPSPAGAAEPARSLEEFARGMKPGQKVQVLERSGRLTEGVITEASESSLTVFAGENRTVAAEEVLRVDRAGDPVRNGILIGAVAGAALGLAGMWAYPEDAESKAECPTCKSPSMVAFFAVSGAGWGWLIDHLMKGRTTLYEAPMTRSRASVSVAPILGKGRRGLTVAVGF